MLELASLGLLQKEPLHGYQLTKTLELFMGSCISVNYGAIYPLLRRLERQELITSLSTAEPSNSRIIYRITPSGKVRWRSHMLATPNESWVNSRSRFMIKSFFFQELEPSDRIMLIQHRLDQCYERQQMLLTRKSPLAPLDPYQTLTCQRSTDMIQTEVNWLKTLLTQDRQDCDQRNTAKS